MLNNLTERPEWTDLERHFSANTDINIPTLFQSDLAREKSFTAEIEGIRYNYSKNLVTEETLDKLCALAEACDIDEWREKMFSAYPINNTENRAAMHVAMRGSCMSTALISNKSANEIGSALHQKMELYVNHIHNSKSITDIVNIGIGGSDIGPRMVCEALSHLSNDHKRVHFLSSIDPVATDALLSKLDPKRTLFLIASKTFGTMETITNFNLTKEWSINGVGEENWHKYFCALTGNVDAAKSHGIAEKYIFNVPDWVGGRFSLWSSSGLSIALSLGFDNFKRLLNGAYEADKHFLTQPHHKNIPVLMALIGIWYRNFFKFNTHCILPYSNALKYLPQYIQQLDMESNGKTVDRDGNRIHYPTSPIIFGGVGIDSQHAFFQHLHQGSDIVPCDFIALKISTDSENQSYKKIAASVIGQTKALAYGHKNTEEYHKNFEGNRPSSTFWIKDMSPETLGKLLAFYEHKTFVQGIIWNLNSFDQWGVQLGKDLANEALNKIL